MHELPALIEAEFPATGARGISGHSMGGHGALVIALRNPGRYRSVSAFSPIVAPSHVPWGQKAFHAYLGDNPADWAQWDACALIAAGPQQQRQCRGAPPQCRAVAAGPPQAGGRRQQRGTGQENEGAYPGRTRPQGQHQAMAQHIQQRQHYRHASPDPQGRLRAR